MKYPPRPQGSDVFRFGYLCICGHYEHHHVTGVLGIWLTKCQQCMCPKYIADKTLDENNNPIDTIQKESTK